MNVVGTLRGMGAVGIGFAALAGCPAQRQPTDAQAPSVGSVGSTAPGPSNVAPNPPPAATSPLQPIQKGECPMAIVPGRSLGPVQIGQDASTLAATGLPVKSLGKHEESETFDMGPLRASTCGGKVVDVWLDDLRKAPDCVSVSGKPVARTIGKKEFAALFDGCRDAPPRIGGTFVECHDGGVRIGTGMGDFIQVRVARKGSSLDDECADILDDGKPAALADAELATLLQRTLDIDVLAQYWHTDVKGRDPLHMVKTPLVPSAPKLMMFGSPVVWIDATEVAKRKLPAFEITKIESTKRRVVIGFRYPVEGVFGHVRFQKRHKDWQVVEKRAAER